MDKFSLGMSKKRYRYINILESVLREYGAVEVLRNNSRPGWEGKVEIDALLADGRVFSFEYAWGDPDSDENWDEMGYEHDDIVDDIKEKAKIIKDIDQYRHWREMVFYHKDPFRTRFTTMDSRTDRYYLHKNLVNHGFKEAAKEIELLDPETTPTYLYNRILDETPGCPFRILGPYQCGLCGEETHVIFNIWHCFSKPHVERCESCTKRLWGDPDDYRVENHMMAFINPVICGGELDAMFISETGRPFRAKAPQ